MEESETLISEREIPRLLGEYQGYAVNCIINQQYQQGLEILMRSQELIQAAISQDALVSIELIILTEHTFAFYYQCVEDQENKAICLNKTISLFKKYTKTLPKALLTKASHRILKARVLMKLHLQLFSGFLSLKNTEAATIQLQSALRRSQSIIHNTLRACQEHIHRHKAISASPIKNQQYVLLDSPHYQLFHGLVQKSLPILLYLDEKTATHPKISIPTPDLSFEDLLTVHPLDFESLTRGPEIMEELEKDLMLEKIVFHIAIQYFLAVQLRQLRADESLIEAKILVKRSWRICRSFLQPECKMYQAVARLWEKYKNIGVNRVRSISRMKPQGKLAKSEARSASSNKFRPMPTKKLNDTTKESRTDQSLTPLRRKIIGKFKKMKLK